MDLTIEGSFIRNVVNQQYSHCAPVVGRCNCAKSLLTCCVPYLEFYSLAVKLDGADLEVYAYGCNEGGGK